MYEPLTEDGMAPSIIGFLYKSSPSSFTRTFRKRNFGDSIASTRGQLFGPVVTIELKFVSTTGVSPLSICCLSTSVSVARLPRIIPTTMAPFQRYGR